MWWCSFNLTPVRLLLLTAQLSNMTMAAGQGSMLHLQSSMQHSPLGISIVNSHSGSVSFNENRKDMYLLRVMMPLGMTVKYLGICFPDVSILHEWAALPGIPVPYLSLPAYTPAGVLFNPNWTTGSTKWILAQNIHDKNNIMVKGYIIFSSHYSYSVQLVGFIAMSPSTTKVYSHNLAWPHRTRIYSPSLSPSQYIPTGQSSLIHTDSPKYRLNR